MEIAIVTPSRRPEIWNQAIENIVRQKLQPDIVILIKHRTDANANNWRDKIKAKRLFILQANYQWELSDVLRYGYDYAENFLGSEGLITTMDDDDWYGEDYLTELSQCFIKYPDAGIIGKQHYWVRWMEENRPPELFHAGFRFDGDLAASVAGPTIAVNVSSYRKDKKLRHPIGSLTHADSGFIEAAHANGHTLYTTSPQNFFLQRYGSKHGHGWNL